MADYYQLLGIPESSNSTQIRAAYKKMAMQYHPDRNAGDKHAEEIFKAINEAYHVLSDPLKKARYDARLNSTLADATEEYWYEVRRRKYTQWKNAQQPYYRVDKDYFRIQGLAFLVFIIIAGFCFGVIHTVNYLIEQERAQHWNENSRLLKHANTLFLQGHFEEAFNLINKLRTQEPLDFRIGFAHDSLVTELRKLADEKFATQDFQGAVHYFETLKQHELPVRLETLERIATCQYHLGRFDESLIAMKHLHNQQPWNLQLVYQIGLINLEKLDNKKEALHYFTLGKKLFKKNLSSVYGEAFELVMDPEDVPDIYYEIFVARGKTNLALKDYEEALTDCNWVVYLRRSIASSYLLRIHVKTESKNHHDLCQDIREAKKLGADVADLQRKYCR